MATGEKSECSPSAAGSLATLSQATINGGEVVYEVLGEDSGIKVALTPGGRGARSMVRPLAERLADAGLQALIWDRPNAGASEIQFSTNWPSESHMHADTLQQLIHGLGWGPTVIAGASAGSRVSVITASHYPEVTRGLFLWHVVGGVYSSMSLACLYILGNIATAKRGGMEAVMAMPEWSQRIKDNPANKARFEALSDDEFISVLKLWLNAYVPTAGQVIPGVPDHVISSISVPTALIRAGEHDEEHPLITCYAIHALIRGSRVLDAPWADDAWEQSFKRTFQTGAPPDFDLTAEVAPLIVDFCRQEISP